MKRNFIIAATTAVAMMSAPAAFAAAHMMKFDPENTLAMSAEPIPTVEASVGSQVVTANGMVVGTVTEIMMENDGNVDIMIDPTDNEVNVGTKTVMLSIPPSKVSVTEGVVALDATETDFANNADTDGDSSDYTKISIQ